MDNQTAKQNQTYNLSILKKGFLYKKRTYQYAVAVFAVILIVGFGLRPLFDKLLFSTDNTTGLSNILNPLLFVSMILLAFGIVFMGVIKGNLYVKARTKFAEANNLEACDADNLRNCLPASVIRSGAHSEKIAGYRLDIAQGSAIVIDYSYVIGSGKNSTAYVYAIATMQFDKEYPHIFLDSRSNGTAGRYQSSQRVQLEGNFNKYFDLFMPEGSGAGSLTVLSPDVMQTLVDQVQPFDVEIDKNSLSLITVGYGYTQENLSSLLNAGNVLSKEFSEINRSWQPVYNLQGKPFELRRTNGWKRIAIIVLVYLVYFIISKINIHN